MTPASFFFFSANPDANQQYHRFQQPKPRPETSQQPRKRTASSRHASVLLSPSGMNQNLKGKVFSRKESLLVFSGSLSVFVVVWWKSSLQLGCPKFAAPRKE
uniref:Uncharacterized protein n=1 Tax=Solanum demissum TaxID=50514 RepID=Q0KIS2_SOLDE|nr:hypothetical protein SDM1_46t00004 [Solanum demissum]